MALTHAFIRAAEQAGMSDDEVTSLVSHLAAHPTAGQPIPGTGGCRKVRVGGHGKGKSGGYRTITFFSGDDLPLFLITVFSKGERSDLSKSEHNRLHTITKAIVAEYRQKAALTKKGG